MKPGYVGLSEHQFLRRIELLYDDLPATTADEALDESITRLNLALALQFDDNIVPIFWSAVRVDVSRVAILKPRHHAIANNVDDEDVLLALDAGRSGRVVNCLSIEAKIAFVATDTGAKDRDVARPIQFRQIDLLRLARSPHIRLRLKGLNRRPIQKEHFAPHRCG
ncbi:hypothetical protein SAMN05192568_107515 [Methylobacterium pseudosasicola]|uniref:Uncharacterized protein n=1 Tax=Methylobacterium pseudosasicola TaxID=582667 RepID=A0A1I4URU0_9HYPH|nr:hypothetical protein SAMN05192568_107515 [Methylobacterium pseudosasicola]